MRHILYFIIISYCLTGVSQAADWFWRPLGENEEHNFVCKNKICDGKTYETAWRLSSYRLAINPEGSVDLSQMSDGDTLYVCGHHFRSNYDNRLLINRGNIIVSGECPGDAGSFEGSGIQIDYADNITIKSISFRGMDAGGHGIRFIGSSYLRIQDNHIQGYRSGIIAMRDTDNPSHYVRIVGNTILDVGQGIFVGNYSGRENNHWTIAYNRIENVGKGPYQFPQVDAEAIGIQGGQHYRIKHNRIRNATYGINLYACENHHVKGIHIMHNVLTQVTGGPSSWPSRGIFRTCFFPVEGHDRQRIRYNTVVNVDDAGIRWVCGNGAKRCEISDNDVALTTGIVTLGHVIVEDNMVVNWPSPH